VTDRTQKLLAKLDAKNRKAILLVTKQLRAGNEKGLDIKPLKGHKNVYRVRVGNYRIVYSRQNGKYNQIDIVRRDDRTYRSL
jgi:mRNA-degrading endonuclease RelE of RelBE toxin-antitoxin system